MEFRRSLSEWDALSSAERLSDAHNVARQLPTGFELLGLDHYAMGGVDHEIARFRYDASEFVLVPGGDATLGFDPSSFSPSPEQRNGFQGEAETLEFDPSLTKFLEGWTTPLRSRNIRGMLVERTSIEGSAFPVPLNWPDLQEFVAWYRKEYGGMDEKGGEYHMGKWHYRIECEQGHPVRAQQLRYVPAEERKLALRDRGFRLLTSDEWEYVCGAGSRTLFRWGDFCPCNFYPSDSPKPQVWGVPFNRWASEHKALNAFGVVIASDPYLYEHVEETQVGRGGDGGASTCGGYLVCSWLTLATAYFEPMPNETIDEFGWVRRVLPLY